MPLFLPPPRQDQRFTMMEVLVASIVLALMAAGIYATIAMSTRMIYDARQRLEAQSLAVDRCWIAYHDSYDKLLSYPSIGTVSAPTGHSLFPFGGTVRTGVAQYSNYVRITVRVDWAENGRALYESFTVDRYDDR